MVHGTLPLFSRPVYRHSVPSSVSCPLLRLRSSLSFTIGPVFLPPPSRLSLPRSLARSHARQPSFLLFLFSTSVPSPRLRRGRSRSRSCAHTLPRDVLYVCRRGSRTTGFSSLSPSRDVPLSDTITDFSRFLRPRWLAPSPAHDAPPGELSHPLVPSRSTSRPRDGDASRLYLSLRAAPSQAELSSLLLPRD